MLYAVIMAGGSGTRFWPESRADRPKQLLPMVGGSTLLESTVDRLGDLVPRERLLIATTAELAGAIASQLSFLPREAILAEPCKRDTAPCIGLAAHWVLRQDPDAVMAVMPADHLIEPEEVFRDAIRRAVGLVEESPGRLVTFGIRPNYPAESFGYIERGEVLGGDSGAAPSAAYRVARFHEKPKAAVAEEYFRSGRFYWNSGIFVWRAQTILDAIARYQPALGERLEAIAAAAGSMDFPETLQREFSAAPRVSIDYAVMERAEEVVVIEAPFRWDDLGSWRSLERHGQADAEGNLAGPGRCIAIDAHGCIVRSADPQHLVALLGVGDLVVVTTPDATLVARKQDEESIRRVIAEIEARGWRQYLASPDGSGGD